MNEETREWPDVEIICAVKPRLHRLPPSDYLAPEWDKYDKVHNWRNHISDEVADMWDTFTLEQKAALARSAAELASAEEWE